MEKRSIINKIDLKEGAKNSFREVLDYLGIEVKGNWCRCPSPNHNDRHITNAVINSGNQWEGTVKCYACGYFADAYTLAKDICGFSTDPEIWEYLSPVIGVPVKYSDGTTFVPARSIYKKKSEEERLLEKLTRGEDTSSYLWKDYRKYYIDSYHRLDTPDGRKGREYFHKRGISDGLIARLRLGYDYTFNAPRVIIPITKSFYLARDIRSGLTKEAERYSKIKPKGERIALMNPMALKGSDPVFIVEGEFDALSIMEMGHQAISLGGVANITALEKLLLHMTLKGVKVAPIMLCLDSDEAGRKAARKFIKDTKTLGVLEWGQKAFYCNLDDKSKIDDIWMGCKDANELLVKDRALFAKVLEKAANRARNKYENACLLS